MLDRTDRDQISSIAAQAARGVAGGASAERVAAAAEYYAALITEIAERQHRQGKHEAEMQLSMAALLAPAP